MQGRTFALNRKDGTHAWEYGKAKCEGKVGDMLTITSVFPVPIAVNAGGFYCFDAAYDSVIIDPFQLSRNTLQYAQMYQEYHIHSMELDFERLVGMDTTLAKGRLVAAIFDDPMMPLYDTATDYQSLTEAENSATWSINPNETGGKDNMRLRYVNKKQKLMAINNNVAFPAGFTKANGPAIREAYQLVIAMAQKGAFTPTPPAPNVQIGYLNVVLKLGLYGRASNNSVVSVVKMVDGYCTSLGGKIAGGEKPKGIGANKSVAVLGHHTPLEGRKAVAGAIVRALVAKFGSDCTHQPELSESDDDEGDDFDDTADSALEAKLLESLGDAKEPLNFTEDVCSTRRKLLEGAEGKIRTGEEMLPLERACVAWYAAAGDAKAELARQMKIKWPFAFPVRGAAAGVGAAAAAGAGAGADLSTDTKEPPQSGLARAFSSMFGSKN